MLAHILKLYNRLNNLIQDAQRFKVAAWSTTKWAPLVALILQQSNVYFNESKDTQRQAKLNARKTHWQQQAQDAAEHQERLSNDRRALKVSSEEGGNWKQSWRSVR